MADQFLYLTTTGRTSRLPRDIEIWFVEHEGRYYLVSERREESGWVKNIQGNPEVRFSIGTRTAPTSAAPSTSAHGRAVVDEQEPDLARTVRALMVAKYGWSDGLIVEVAPQREASKD